MSDKEMLLILWEYHKKQIEENEALRKRVERVERFCKYFGYKALADELIVA